MRRRGIVMELTMDSAVVLAGDGQFCRLPKTTEMSVGSEVSWEVPDAVSVPVSPATRRRRRRHGTWYRAGVASIAACLAIAAGVWWTVGIIKPENAYAMVSVDINPSVALTIDKDRKVMDVEGINTDGKRLLSVIDVKGETLKQALSDIVAAAAKQGMIPNEDTILISAAPASSSAQVDQIQSEAEQSVQAAIHSNPAIEQRHPTVYAIGVSKLVWHAADKAKISPGKLAAYLIATKEGEQVSLGQIEGKKLGNILSSPDTKSAIQALNSDDLTTVQQWLNNLEQSTSMPTLPTLNGVGINAPSGPSDASQNYAGNSDGNQGNGPNGAGHGNNNGNGHGQTKNHGNGNGNGHGTGHANGSGNAHGGNGVADGNAQNSVTVQIGNSTITVPLGPSGFLGGTAGDPIHMDNAANVDANAFHPGANGETTHGNNGNKNHHGADEQKDHGHGHNQSGIIGELLNVIGNHS